MYLCSEGLRSVLDFCRAPMFRETKEKEVQRCVFMRDCEARLSRFSSSMNMQGRVLHDCSKPQLQ